ncbi:NDUFA2, NADH ubiquinone oxidoreductase 10.5kD subunit [Pisolithus croceorrhizus]|nr:NDUFA2, NADH ubiquinone oxidoreductase 10.5kD subunit [Pisolithus croceorrhizus]
MSSFAKALSPTLREVRILFCQSGQASEGTRQFVLANYPVMKKHNPDLPILIREASGTPARVFARFGAFLVHVLQRALRPSLGLAELLPFIGRGVEKHVELDNLSSGDVTSRVARLLSGS